MFGFRRKTSSGPFSWKTRRDGIARLDSDTFDLVIIGGGATGAAIARDAVQRGLTVALIEKGDFASGTSSRSSKLVHGGLRYLKGRHVRLVRESLRERGVLLKIAPHLVQPEPFLLPVYAGDRGGRLKLRIGLTAYDMLAGFGDIAHHTVLSREQMLEAEPLLRADGLKGGFRYHDCLVNDARLTLAMIRSAAESGAIALNYVEATGLEREDDRIAGVTFRDTLSGQTGSVRGRVIVNAAGPWSDRLRDMAGAPPVLRPTKGVHLLLPRARLALSSIVLIPRFDRILFAVPCGDTAYVGTTDTDYTNDPGDATIDDADTAYILDAANALFPNANLTTGDIAGGWAGVRPLVAKEGTPVPSDVSRDYSIESGPEGFYSIAGGKLTTCRAMAESLLDRVLAQEGKKFGWQPRPCRTAQTPIAGGDIDRFDRYLQSAGGALEAGWGLSSEITERLLRAYGTEHVKLLGCAGRDPGLLRPLAEGCPVLRAEAVYAAEGEMAMTLLDFMERRTELMLFDPEHGLSAVEEAASLMGNVIGWGRKERQQQIARYREAVSRMTAVATETPD